MRLCARIFRALEMLLGDPRQADQRTQNFPFPIVIHQSLDPGQTLPSIILVFPTLSIGTGIFVEIATETMVYRKRFTYFNVFQSPKPDKTHSKSDELKYSHRRCP